MDHSKLIVQLKTEIRNVEHIISQYKNLNDIPRVELDLILEKLRFMYDLLYQQKPAVKEDQPLSHKVVEKQETIVDQAIEEASVQTQDELLNIEPADDEKIYIQATPGTEKTTIIAEKYKLSDSYINETIAKGKKPDMASKLQSKPITDIASAIGLNDKFLFINDLFQGDSKKFIDTIAILNDANDFNEAYNYLYENFEWDLDSENVQKILDLVRRKHIINTNE